MMCPKQCKIVIYKSQKKAQTVGKITRTENILKSCSYVRPFGVQFGEGKVTLKTSQYLMIL